ncbi:MAG: DUF805 domain-containing protein [Proteobacteria bacterium]|nr:DUF805 domain-containing protein [Pseudomonadota bacterium]
MLLIAIFLGLPLAVLLSIAFSSKELYISRLLFLALQILLAVMAFMYYSIVVSEIETLYPNLDLENVEQIPVYISLLLFIGMYFFTITGTMSCAFRAQDMGFSKWSTLVMYIPIIGSIYFLFLFFWPSRSYV